MCPSWRAYTISLSMIWEMEWEMMMTVRSFLMASMADLICSVAMASSEAVGSSRKMMGGFLRNIRAMAIRGCWPPERCVAAVSKPFGRAAIWS